MNLKRSAIIAAIIISCSSRPLFAADGLAAAKPDEARLITLAQGIEIVLKDNRLIRVAFPTDNMAYQEALVSRSALLPNLNLNASKTFYRYQPAAKIESQNVNTAEKEPFAYGFDVYQTLFDFGKSLNNYRASKELWQASKANIESVKRVATLEFIVAYFNLLEAQKMITIFKKEVESLTAYLNDIERLCEQGAAVKNDLLPAKVKLSDARQKLISAENAREITSARVKNILALPLNKNIIVRDMSMQPPEFPVMENAWDIAEQERPEVAFYSDQIKSSLSSQRAKAVENFPVVFVDGGYDYTQNRYVVHEGNASVELGAKMNFYDGGAARAELSKEHSKEKQLTEEKGKLVEDIKLEIEDSYFTLKNSVEKLAVTKDAVEQADENVRVYRVKYQTGSATPTDVLEAITLQTIAQINYYGDDYALKRNYAKLMYSMGIDLALIYERMERGKNGSAKE